MLLTGIQSPDSIRIKQTGRLNHALNFAHKNWCRPLTLNQLADSACLSKYHFSRLFQRYTGESPLSLLKRIRLENCAYLLSYHGELSINQIALNSGFSSQQTFSRAFDRQFGQCPRQFRQQFSENLPAALSPGLANQYAATTLAELTGQRSLQKPYQLRLAHLPATRVAYFRNIGSYGVSDGIDSALASIRHWARKNDLWQAGSKCIGASWDSNQITPNLYCKYDACIRIPDDYHVDRTISTQWLPAGRYAIYRAAYRSSGEISLIWRVFTRYLRTAPRFSTYCMSSKPCFEIFDQNQHTGEPEVELYIQLVRRFGDSESS